MYIYTLYLVDLSLNHDVCLASSSEVETLIKTLVHVFYWEIFLGKTDRDLEGSKIQALYLWLNQAEGP